MLNHSLKRVFLVTGVVQFGLVIILVDAGFISAMVVLIMVQ